MLAWQNVCQFVGNVSRTTQHHKELVASLSYYSTTVPELPDAVRVAGS